MTLIFDWDTGNEMKNITKHRIDNDESESVFADKSKLVLYDKKHGQDEVRFYCIGRSLHNRILRVTFTTRRGKIRIISSRPASAKEKHQYEIQK